MDVCFECDAAAAQMHHVVPRSLGGTRTLPLCDDCHAKVHDRNAVSIGKLTSKAMRRLREDGHYTGGVVPYGYALRDEGWLVKDEHEQAVIARAKSLRESGLSLRAIAVELANAGIVSRTGKPFQSTAIANMTSGVVSREAMRKKEFGVWLDERIADMQAKRRHIIQETSNALRF